MLSGFEHLRRKRLVRYEDLIARPEPVVGSVLSLLGIDRELELLQSREYRIHRQRHVVTDRMNERSIKLLSEKDLGVIESIARANLARFGYVRESAVRVA